MGLVACRRSSKVHRNAACLQTAVDGSALMSCADKRCIRRVAPHYVAVLRRETAHTSSCVACTVAQPCARTCRAQGTTCKQFERLCQCIISKCRRRGHAQRALQAATRATRRRGGAYIVVLASTSDQSCQMDLALVPLGDLAAPDLLDGALWSPETEVRFFAGNSHQCRPLSAAPTPLDPQPMAIVTCHFGKP